MMGNRWQVGMMAVVLGLGAPAIETVIDESTARVWAQSFANPKAEAYRLLEDCRKRLGQEQWSDAVAACQAAVKAYQKAGNRYGEVSTSINLGIAQKNVEQYEAAISTLQGSLKIAQEVADGQLAAIALWNLGAVYEALGQSQKAAELQQQTQSFFEQQKTADHLFEKGLQQSQVSQFRESLQSWEQALKLYRTIQDRLGESQSLGNLGNAYASLGDYLRAIDFHQQHLAISREIGNQLGESQALGGLGIVYDALGDYPRAIEFHQKSLAISREIGYRRGESQSLGNLGLAYASLGDYPRAIDFHQQHLAISREIGNQLGESNSLGNLGNAYASLGDYPRAIDFHQQSLTISRKIGNQLGESNSLGNLGNAYASLGDYPRAIDFYQQSLTISRKIRNRLGESNSLGNLGRAYRALGDYPRAIEFHQQHLATSREIGNRLGESQALGGLGIVYDALGDYPRAIEFHQQHLAISREIGNRLGESQALGNLGNAYDALGDYPRAIEFLQQTLAISREIGNQEGEGLSLSNLAYTLNRMGQSELAITLFKQSVNVREGIRTRNRTLSSNLQQSYTETVAGSYRQLADLLIEKGRIAEAQQVLELLKLEELNEFTRGLRSPKSLAQIKLNQAEAEILKQHTSLIAFSQKLYNCRQTNCADKADLNKQYKALALAFDQFVQDIITTQIENRKIQVSQGTQDFLASSQSVVTAQPNSILIYPLVLDNKVRILWAAKGGAKGAKVCNLNQEQLNQLVTQFQKQITERQDINTVQATGKNLYDCLVKPLESELQTNNIRNLIFVPDRVTNYIPMGALHDGQQFLIQRYTVTNILAASVTDTQDRIPTTPNQVPTLGLGLSQATPGFNALRYVPEELDTIIRQPQNDKTGIYPGRVFQNQAFTETALTENLLNHKILHIATHAEFLPTTPRQSYFLLGDGTKFSIPEVNILLDLKHLHLVVLSACETAKGSKDHNGIEVAGISSFFTGGQDKAKAVMASLWKVNDASTSTLMQQFYRNLATGNMTKTAALQQAQITMLKGDIQASSDDRSSVVLDLGAGSASQPITRDPSHPYYWAPFILIGNGL